MPLSPGASLAHYTIVGPLGAGAMGEVYRAKDTRLDREVAIKVLPEHFADDVERLKRFEREAKALATLNHPNVAQIHGVDQVGDLCFLVLELVPGESLEERLKRGPLPVDESIDCCRQIAEGLEAAHEAGVIHRDLKPANVRITPDGKVKVLDFGLAKPARDSHDGSSTDSVLSTEAGRLLGTPTYMAPEQARGKSIDRRVDVWAFGCVLYECLTGQRAFTGETLTDVLGAVLHTEPDLAKLPRDTPRSVRSLLARCLVKEPRQRLRDVGDARLELERARHEPASSEALPTRGHGWIAWTLAAVACAAALGLGLRSLGGPVPADPSPTRSLIALPPEVMLAEFDGSLALSPDCRTLVFAGGPPGQGASRLWIRPLDSLVAQPLVGTVDPTYPCWSPDGRSIAFFSEGKLKRIPSAGGSVTTICDAPSGRGATWTARDEIVFAPTPFGPLFRVRADGGVPVAVTTIPSERASHRLPSALPDGRRILFTNAMEVRDAPGDEGRVGVRMLDLDTGEVVRVSDDASDACFVAPGDLCLVRNGNLVAQPFDASSGKLEGEQRLVAEAVAFTPTRLTGRYSVSPEGTVVYQAAFESRLEWFDLEGRSLGTLGEPGRIIEASVSPDGRRVAVLTSRPDGGTLGWIVDARSGLRTRESALDDKEGVSWAPDGRTLATGNRDNANVEMSLVTLDGSTKARVIGHGWPSRWSRDGAWLLYGVQRADTGTDVYAMRTDGSGEPQIVAATRASEYGRSFSPDGRWVLVASDQSGRHELSVAPFGRSGPIRPLTSVGVSAASEWTDDGRIVYRSSGGELWEIEARTSGEEIEFGEPRALFGGRKVPASKDPAVQDPISFAPDGKRMLVVVSAAGEAEPPLVLVQHGFAGGADR